MKDCEWFTSMKILWKCVGMWFKLLVSNTNLFNGTNLLRGLSLNLLYQSFQIVRLFWDESFVSTKSKFIFKGKNSFFDQITFFRRSVRFSSEYFLLTISFFQYTFKLLPSCLQDTALVLTTRYAPSDWYIQQSAYRYFGQYVLIFLDSTFLIFLH